MEREITVDGVACQIPEAVFRFINDVMSVIDGERRQRQTVFGYDVKLRPYRTGQSSVDAADAEKLLHEYESRFDSLLLSLGGKSSPAAKSRRGSQRSSVVGRVEGRPIYQEVLDRIPAGADRKAIMAVLEQSDYSRSSASILATSYQRFLEGSRNGEKVRSKGKFSHLTEVDKIGGIKIYAEVLETIRERGGADLERTTILDILEEYGFSRSSAQVRARYYIERI